MEEWYKLDAFDKTMQTFLVGGLVSIMSFLILNAPLDNLILDSSTTIPLWENWFYTNLSGIIISESMISVVTWILIKALLVDPFSSIISYST